MDFKEKNDSIVDVSKENLYSLFQEIKHKGIRLSTNQTEDLVRLLNRESIRKELGLIGVVSSCLSYGSNYVQENPLIFNEVLDDKNVYPYDVGDIFDSIRFSGVVEFYIDVLSEYAKCCNWNFDEFEPHSSALEVIGNYVFKTQHSKLYGFLLYQYHEAWSKMKQEIVADTENDFLFMINNYLSSIYFAIEGSKSYRRKRIKRSDLRDDIILVPEKLKI